MIFLSINASSGLFGLFDDSPKFLIIESDVNIGICDLNDVTCTSLQNNQVIVFNSSTGRWENATQAGGGGGGRTYTAISPIVADNDNNILSLNVLPTSDWNGLFDGNNSTFYIDWNNSVNRLFSLLTLDNNSSFDARYLPHILRTYTGIAPIIVDSDANTIQVSDANFEAKGVLSVDPRYLSIDSGNLNFDTNTQDLLHFFDGTILETIDVDVNSDGTDVNLFIGREDGGNITLVFNDGYFFFDTTPPKTIELTAGSDTNPTLNYVFIPNSTQVLTVNTTGFPTDAEFASIATVEVQSASGVQIDGPYKVHVWTDHSDDEDTHQGHQSEINSWIRNQSGTWMDGVSQTLTITSNAGRPDNVDFAVTSGTVLQLHDHAYPAFDTASDSNIFVVNDSGAAFTKINDLNALLTDSAGGSMSNRYFTIVIWGVVSEGSGDSKLMLNLPSGSYNKEDDAIDDVSGFANFSIPIDFRGTGFLISKLVLHHQPASGGTWTSIVEGDLRGLFPSTAAAGGSGAVTTSFPDNLFLVFNVTDSTKELQLDLSGISTSTRRLWTVQDGNGTVPLLEFANTWIVDQLFDTSVELQFRDSGQNINSPSAGVLSVTAPTLNLVSDVVTVGDGGGNVSLVFDGVSNDGNINWVGAADIFSIDDDVLIGSGSSSIGLSIRDAATKLLSINTGELDIQTGTSVNLDTGSVRFKSTSAAVEARFYEDNGPNYVGFEAPALSADQIWVLPDADSTGTQFLTSDGSGNLSWSDINGTDISPNYVTTGDINFLNATVGGNILFATNKELQFRDTDINMNSPIDGDYQISADNSITMNTPDFNTTGNINMHDGNFFIDINKGICLNPACTKFIVNDGNNIVWQG